MEDKLFKNNIILKEAIVKTIAFFDIFDFPLTDFEVWQFLYAGAEEQNFASIDKPSKKVETQDFASIDKPSKKVETQDFASLREVKNVLESNRVGDILETKNGFHFLKGREGIINIRLKRYIYTDRKFKKALRVMQIFKFIPWLKMVAVSNIMGAHNLRDGSDIDFFIIAAGKRVWLTRFFCVSLAKLLGLRPEPGNTRDKICLNFYVSEEAMDLKNLTLLNLEAGLPSKLGSPASKIPDIYFIYWLAGLVPIYDRNSTYEKFMANNNWLKEYLPNWRMKNIAGRRLTPLERKHLNSIRRTLSNRTDDTFLTGLISGLEKSFQSWQIKLMPVALKELKNIGRQVIINDQIIKMHANDRREEYRRRWRDKIKKYNF